MSEVGVQLAPRAGPSVVFGVDAADPDRFLVRGRYLGLRLPVALAILYFACNGQLDGLRREALWRFTGATALAFLAVALAFLRRRLVLDRARGELREELALVVPFARKVRALRGVRRVIVSVENRPASQGHETVYPVDLQGSASRVRVDTVGRWERAAPLAEALARFLGVPLRDTRRGGDVGVEELDQPLRDGAEAPVASAAPERMTCRVTADRPGLFRVDVPRPAVPQTLFLNGILLAFCVLPLLTELAIPLLRGWRPESLREAFLSVGWLLLPALIVGGGSVMHVARNGGTLTVTPERVRFLRNGVLWRREVAIPAERVEDVVLLEPEMGGARSLLAYFSKGVLVVRSDEESFRAGYGLSIPELEWLRSRVQAVLGRARRRGPSKAAAEVEPPEAALPVFPRWSRVWIGLLGLAILGHLPGGPLGAGAALPYLEETGVFVIGTLGNTLLLNALLLMAFAARGGEWRPDLLALAAEGTRSLRRFGGLAPPAAAVALVASGALLAGVAAMRWPEMIPAWRPRPPAVDRQARERVRSTSPAPRKATGPAFSLELPPVPPAIVPSIEMVGSLDPVLASLAGRPVVLLYWAGDEPRLWLPDADRLHRTMAPHGVEVVGVPRLSDEARLRETLGASRIEWRQLLGAPGWSSRVPTAWPQVVVIDAAGEVAYRGRPGAGVEEALGRLVGPAPPPATDAVGVVEGRLLYAGRPLGEASRLPIRFWFRNEWTGREARLQTEADRANSAFRWVGPIGTYLADVSCGPRLDFSAHTSLSGTARFAVTTGEPRRQDISLQRILRLRQPVDNGTTLPPHGQTLAHSSPVRFAWDPLPEADEYRYSLSRVGDQPGDPIVSGETRSPAIEVALGEGTYNFRLSAHGPAGLVGRLEVYGANYRAWSYGFVVK